IRLNAVVFVWDRFDCHCLLSLLRESVPHQDSGFRGRCANRRFVMAGHYYVSACDLVSCSPMAMNAAARNAMEMEESASSMPLISVMYPIKYGAPAPKNRPTL